MTLLLPPSLAAPRCKWQAGDSVGGIRKWKAGDTVSMLATPPSQQSRHINHTAATSFGIASCCRTVAGVDAPMHLAWSVSLVGQRGVGGSRAVGMRKDEWRLRGPHAKNSAAAKGGRALSDGLEPSRLLSLLHTAQRTHRRAQN